MRCCAFIVAVVLAAASSGFSAQLFSAEGLVTDVSPPAFSIRMNNTPMTLQSGRELTVWKGSLFHDLSPLRVGDHIYARYYYDQAGRPIVTKIWDNIVSLSGVINNVGNRRFTVFTNPGMRQPSAYRQENKIVEYNASTIFQDSLPSDIKVSRDVLVIGLSTPNGKVLATRVTVYEGNRPVRMGQDASIMPRAKTQ